MRGLFIAALLVVIVGIVTFVQTSNVTDVPEPIPFPSYTLEQLDGVPITIPDTYPDTVLVINSWASWCLFCADEMPHFVRLQQEYGDQIVVVGVNRQEPATEISAYLDSIGIKHPDDMIVLTDPEDIFFDSIAGEQQAMPQTIFVKADGTVSTHKRGFMTYDDMVRFVEDALAVPESL